jgi:hypothetical protein
MRSRAAAALACAAFLTLTVASSPALAKTAANEPVQATVVAHPTGPTNSVLYVVPAGKRLVVEHFSSEVGVAADTTVNRFVLGVAPDPSTPGGTRFAHFLPPNFSAPCDTCSSGQVEVVASHAVRMYVEAGEALVVNIVFSAAVGPNAFAFYSVSGYLVDAP